MHPLLENNRERMLELARRHGAKNLRVFGSMARGDASPDSDVDVLVELTEGISGLALGGLLMDLQDLLGRPVEVVTERALHPQIRERVLREAIPL